MVLLREAPAESVTVTAMEYVPTAVVLATETTPEELMVIPEIAELLDD